MDPVEITAGRLHLRPWSPYDEQVLLEGSSDPLIRQWTTVPAPYTPELARERVCTTVAGWERGDSLSWAICESTSGKVLGALDLRHQSQDAWDVGFLTYPWARGQSVVPDALGAMARWAFGTLGVSRIEWRAQVGNWSSRRAAEKAGFRYEGVLRGRYRRRDGSVVDEWVASLVPNDVPADGAVTDTRALPPPPVLTDGVVTLRGWTLRDAPDVQRACDDPLTARWLPVPVPYTVADATSYIGSFIAGAWADGTAAELAVTDAVTGGLLGAMGLKLHHRHLGCGEIGYWTAPWARGRGAAGRGAALSARWGLEVLGLNRVELLADVENTASQRAAEKAGFVREGVARRARFVRDGPPRDMVVYALTSADDTS